MANITKEIHVAADAQHVWERIRDVANTHKLFPGVLTDCRMEEGARIATFANGMVVKELIIDSNDSTRRLAYAAVGGRASHHNASVQVFDEGGGKCRIVWTTDFLPNELAPAIGGLVEAGSATMKKVLES